MDKVHVQGALNESGVPAYHTDRLPQKAVPLPVYCHPQLMYQRLRWISHGRHQQLPSVPFLLWLQH